MYLTGGDSSPQSTTGETAEQPDPVESVEPAGPPAPAVTAFLQRTRKALGERGTAHVRMTMSGGAAESVAEGDSSYGPGGSEMRLEMSVPERDGEKIEMLVVDGTSYIAMPGVTPPGTFFEVGAGSPLGSLTGGAGGLSPADSFAGIEAGLEKVEDLGSDEVDGQPAHHFRLHVDSARSLATTGEDALPAGLPETLVYDVWLDDQDRMRRVRYEVAGSTLTMDMTDWGKPVSVSAPAEEDLVEPPPGL
jgi:hypothetical protein